MKYCKKCNTTKPVAEFNNNKSVKGGLQVVCRYCTKQYYIDNKESIKQSRKQYRINNKESIKQYRIYNKEYWKNRRKTDPLYKLTANIRCLVGSSMKKQGFKKTSRTAEILGCDFDFFKDYIEAQFTEGMSWDNSGKWHYDHIVPVSSDLTEERILELNHFSNFQPLWAEENLAKSNRLDWYD